MTAGAATCAAARAALGRELCGHWATAVRREWLVTNGLGGYACGTVALANTRRYHAFLMASLAPPVRAHPARRQGRRERRLSRRSLPPRVERIRRWHGRSARLREIESFAVIDGIPVWRYALADALLEQRIFMAPGANVSYLTLELKRASAPARIEFKPLVDLSRIPRPRAAAGSDSRSMRATRAARCAPSRARGRFIWRSIAGASPRAEEWYWNFFHREEAARGLDALEDLFVPGHFHARDRLGGSRSPSPRAPKRPRRPRRPEVAGRAARAARRPRARRCPRARPAWVADPGHGRGSIHRAPRRRGRRPRASSPGTPGSPIGAATP